MADDRRNCWEFKNCGRGPGGVNVGNQGLCPVALDKRLDGVNHGMNAGRACWVVAGTLGTGEVQCSFAENLDSCKECEFYRSVRSTEFPHFHFSSVLLRQLEIASAPVLSATSEGRPRQTSPAL